MWRRVLNDGPPLAQADAAEVVQQVLAAKDLGSFDQAAARLRGVVPGELKHDSRTAFWINLYNALFRHAVLVLRPTGSVLTNLLLFERASYRVGASVVSLSEIEHGVLRRNQRAAPFFRRPFSAAEVRFEWQVERVDPRIHFALNCGAVSCPPIRAYAADELDRQLDLATRSYLAQHTQVDRARLEVTLSRLISLYAEDFGSKHDAVAFTARHLEGDDGRWLEENGPRCRVKFGGYDWRLVG